MNDTAGAVAADGEPDLLARARQALLDALDALQEHRNSVVVIGARAIYLHTGAATTPVAEATKDSDLAIDVRGSSGSGTVGSSQQASSANVGICSGRYRRSS